MTENPYSPRLNHMNQTVSNWQCALGLRERGRARMVLFYSNKQASFGIFQILFPLFHLVKKKEVLSK